MKKIIMPLIVLCIALLVISCKQLPKKDRILEPITKEYFIGKNFIRPAIMGAKILQFKNKDEVSFTVRDKRSFGYSGAFSLLRMNGKEYIKITNIQKFGKRADWQDALRNYHKDYVLIEIISPTELKVEHSGTTLNLLEENEKLNKQAPKHKRK